MLQLYRATSIRCNRITGSFEFLVCFFLSTRILFRIYLFPEILFWNELLNIDTISSFLHLATEIKVSLIWRPFSRDLNKTIQFRYCVPQVKCWQQTEVILLTNKWEPTAFVFLSEIRGKKKRFNLSWRENYLWCRYSESEKGVNCLYCVL